MRDDPTLRDLPLAVGGAADQRGVVATCNYVARSFGVHSAMATAQAIKRCPNLVVLRPSMEKYRVASRQILAIYRDYTELVEPLSLDEAYLDVTHATQHNGSATLIAQEIRARIEATVGITASAGIAPNKFVAKVASDWHKPNGQFVVRPHEVDAFVAALPVKKLFGVGKVTAAKLQALGVVQCGDLRGWSRGALLQHFGKFGERLFQLCRGIDARAVNPLTERKSISVEETYVRDLPSLAACHREMESLLASLAERIVRADVPSTIHKLFVKLRFSDFRQTTVECVANTVDAGLIDALLTTGFQRGARPVRLLGVGVRLQGLPAPVLQVDLFSSGSDTAGALVETTDSLQPDCKKNNHAT
jgi:DNA polymerase-4